MRAARPLLFALLWLAAAGQARGELRETIEWRDYGVDASTASLADALLRDSPIREGGRVFHGYTRWFLSWQIDTGERGRWFAEARPEGCRIEAVSLQLRARITLPRLDAAPEPLRKDFEEYLARLTVHELGHVDVARRAAAAIERELLAMASQPRCGDLRRAADARASALLQRFIDEERRYDRDTGHGRTQGAVLP